MERLSGLDAAFLYLETPTSHLHVAWAAVLDTRDAPGAGSPRRLCELVDRRLHRLPALRKRLADPRLGYAHPDWIDVDVDPTDHCTVHEAADLETVAAAVVAQPLDRDRPLWEMHVVEGLPDGRTGLIMKLHHAVLDGPSGAELMVQLLDLERHPVPVPPAADGEPAPAEPDRARGPRPGRWRMAEVRKAVDVWTAARRWDVEHPEVVVPGAFGAARTPLNQPITARRVVRFTTVDLDVLDKLRRDTGSTVNDVVLAIVGGALRRYLLRHGALPGNALLAMVPVSTWGTQSATGGNNLSALVTTLATDVGDPVERLAKVTRITNVVKQRHDDLGLAALVGLYDVVPPRTGQVFTGLAQWLGLSRWGPLAYNVVVSNVPGPDVPFYCNGALVESAFPMGPITDGSALNVTVVSYLRHLAFGLVACPDVVPDIDELRRDVDAEIDALRLARA